MRSTSAVRSSSRSRQILPSIVRRSGPLPRRYHDADLTVCEHRCECLCRRVQVALVRRWSARLPRKAPGRARPAHRAALVRSGTRSGVLDLVSAPTYIGLFSISHIEEHGLDSEGLYRVSPRQTSLQHLATRMEKEESAFEFGPNDDVPAVAGLLKVRQTELLPPKTVRLTSRATALLATTAVPVVPVLFSRVSLLSHFIASMS